MAGRVRRCASVFTGATLALLPLHERVARPRWRSSGSVRSSRSAGCCGGRRGPALVGGCARRACSWWPRSATCCSTASQNRWVSETNQWANQQVRTSLAAVNEVVAAAGEPAERARRELRRHRRSGHRARTPPTAGRRRTRTCSAPGCRARRSSARSPTSARSRTSSPASARRRPRAARATTDAADLALRARPSGDPTPSATPTARSPTTSSHGSRSSPSRPVVFLIGQYYGGSVQRRRRLLRATSRSRRSPPRRSHGVEVGPDVYVIEGDGLWTPAARGRRAGPARPPPRKPRSSRRTPARSRTFRRTCSCVALLALLLVVPGWLASSWLGIRTTVDRIALIPGMSIVMRAARRASRCSPCGADRLSVAKGWTVVARRDRRRRGAPRGRRVAAAAARRVRRASSTRCSRRSPTATSRCSWACSSSRRPGRGSCRGRSRSRSPSAARRGSTCRTCRRPTTCSRSCSRSTCRTRSSRRSSACSSTGSRAAACVVGRHRHRRRRRRRSRSRCSCRSARRRPRAGPSRPAALIVGLLAVQACVRVALAVKSAAMPDVLSGRDLLQGNGLSQAGGALAQIFGIVFGGALAGFVPPFVPVVVGAVVLLRGCLRRQAAAPRRGAPARDHVRPGGLAGRAQRRRRPEGGREPRARRRSVSRRSRCSATSSGGSACSCSASTPRTWWPVATPTRSRSCSRASAGSSAARSAWSWPRSTRTASPPVRLLLGSMVLLGIGTIVGGVFVSVAGFAVDAVHRVLLVLRRQDLGRHDHAADDARRLPRAGVRVVRHRLQPRLHRAGADPVPASGPRTASRRRARS